MRINITGKSTKLSRKEIRHAAHFFARLLLSDRLSKTLSLKIIFSDMGKHPGGECGWVDNNIRPKEFEIEIANNYGRRSQLLSLAHEMVHLKQFAKGELVYLLSSRYSTHSKFRNTRYDCSKVDYYDQPWEIEAYGRELVLYNRYMKFIKTQK